MLSTALAIPEDKDELALTLNGKKRKLNKSDFEKAFVQSGLDTKVTNRLFLRFEQILPQLQTFIETSPFLNDEVKEKYRRLIMDRWKCFTNCVKF
jgi:serine/threonine-protein kinase HipA